MKLEEGEWCVLILTRRWLKFASPNLKLQFTDGNGVCQERSHLHNVDVAAVLIDCRLFIIRFAEQRKRRRSLPWGGWNLVGVDECKCIHFGLVSLVFSTWQQNQVPMLQEFICLLLM